MPLSRACCVRIVCGLILVAPALAAANSLRFDIPAQPLPSALKAFAAQAHVQLLYVYKDVAQISGHAVRGELDSRKALEELLLHTGLEAVYRSDTEVTIRPSRPMPAPAARGLRRNSERQTSDRAPANPPNTFRLQEVIVTAQKRKQLLRDVPIPVTAISASVLAHQNKSSLADYYFQVPGLSLTPNEDGGEATIAIRGITTGDFANPTVGVTVDGVPFGPSTANGGAYFAPDIDPNDLARIEVLRGPQGTLYGASSMGGLVNYVTAEPSTEATGGQVELGLAQVHNGPGAGYNASAGLNVPVADTFAIRISGFARENPGYIEDIQTGGRGVNEVRACGGHLSALWRPSVQFSLKLSALFEDNRLSGSPYVTLGSGFGDLQQSFLPNSGTVERKMEAYSALANATIGRFDVTSVTGFSVSRLIDALDYTQAIGPLTALVFPTQNTLYTDNTHTAKFSQELRVATHLGEHIDWLVGGFYTHEYSPWALQFVAESPQTRPLGVFVDTQFSSAYVEQAAFTDLTYHFSPRFDVQFGGRESDILQTFAQVSTGPYTEAVLGQQSPAVIPESVAHESAFTYLVTPKWRLSPNVMTYIRVASGFRAGGINSGVTVGLPPEFQPDKTDNYELGVKGSVLNRQVTFDASIYYIDWKNIQLSVLDPTNGQNYFANGSGAKSEGVELQVQAMPMRGLRLGWWISYDDAVLVRDLPADSTVYGAKGDRLPYTSRYSANGSVDYSFPLGQLVVSSGAEVSYVGSRIGAFNTVPQRQYLPAYAKTDFHSRVQADEWTADFYVNNVTDERGIVGGGIGTALPQSFGIIEPRTIGISVTHVFGGGRSK